MSENVLKLLLNYIKYKRDEMLVDLIEAVKEEQEELEERLSKLENKAS